MLPVQNATMADFAGVMQSAVLDRPVVDQTGLTGRYDFTLKWTPDETQFSGMGIRVPPPTGDASAAPGLFTAIQEQLGLKFEATKAPVDVLVVDRAERPSDNSDRSRLASGPPNRSVRGPTALSRNPFDGLQCAWPWTHAAQCSDRPAARNPQILRSSNPYDSEGFWG